MRRTVCVSCLGESLFPSGAQASVEAERLVTAEEEAAVVAAVETAAAITAAAQFFIVCYSLRVLRPCLARWGILDVLLLSSTVADLILRDDSLGFGV